MDGLELSALRLTTVQIILVEMELNVPLWMDITSAHVREDLKENFVTSTLMSATTALVCMEAVKIPMVDTSKFHVKSSLYCLVKLSDRIIRGNYCVMAFPVTV